MALQQPFPGQRDARVRTVTYDPANVVRLNGVIRASTQVVFAADEEGAHFAIGDAVAWEVAPAGSILFLKPREKHPPTNLQIVTTRPDGRKRSYQFELSIAETTLADSYFVVRFAYPGDEIERRRTEAAARGAERDPLPLAHDHLATREVLERLDRGPQSGEAAPDDHEVGGAIGLEGGACGRTVGAVEPERRPRRVRVRAAVPRVVRHEF